MNEARNRDAFKMATDLEKRIIRQVCKMEPFYRDSSNITVFWASHVSKSMCIVAICQPTTAQERLKVAPMRFLT